MKRVHGAVKTVILMLSFLVKISPDVSSQDLPGASADLKTAPAGSLVIAMDHTNQSTSVINAGTGTYLFNLKAYGLSVLFLNSGVNLQWVINTGKAKDAIDFSTTAERISPVYAAPQLLDFRAGPILIFPSDTTGAVTTIEWYNSLLPDSCKVKVYRTTSDVTVDVRYTLYNRPRAALLHDSCDIHRNFMEMASVPTVNYDCVPNAGTLRTGCYTIVTIPHMVPGDLTTYDADSIYNFVMAGGNMLGECESVQTFENLKRFHSSTGVIVDPTGGQYNNFNSNVYNDNPDMAFAQYQGTFRPWLRGAQKVWRYGSANTNNFYSVTSCKRNAADNLYYVASVSKMTGGLGSLVFYLGNHEYFTNDCHTCVSGNAINEQEINGIRLYLNAVLIPSNPFPCTPLAVRLGNFNASKQTDETVLLKWATQSEIENAFFQIEYSADGKKFNSIGKLPSKGNSGEGFNYQFVHSNPQSGMNYYRLKITGNDGKTDYSPVRSVVIGNKNHSLSLFPNPASGSLTLLLDVMDGEQMQVNLYDGSGKLARQKIVIVRNQRAELNLEGMHSGIYWVTAATEKGEQFKSKLIITQR